MVQIVLQELTWNRTNVTWSWPFRCFQEPVTGCFLSFRQTFLSKWSRQTHLGNIKYLSVYRAQGLTDAIWFSFYHGLLITCVQSQLLNTGCWCEHHGPQKLIPKEVFQHLNRKISIFLYKKSVEYDLAGKNRKGARGFFFLFHHHSSIFLSFQSLELNSRTFSENKEKRRGSGHIKTQL